MQFIKEIEKEENLLVDTVKKTLQIAKNKINSIEVFIKKTIGISVNIRNNVLENVEFNSSGALFVTVYNQFSKGSVSSKDFSDNGIKKMLQIAFNISQYSSSDFFSGLPDMQLLCHNAIDLDLFHPWEFDVNHAIKLASITEKSALNCDKRIVNSEGSFFNGYITLNVFGNSLGMLEKYKSSRYSIYNSIIAQDKNSMERDFHYSVSRNINNLDNPKSIGQKTAFRALSRLGSRKINTLKSPIIFSSEIAHSFFSHFAESINGDNVIQKSTFLINDLEKEIFPIWLNIKEDPHIKTALGSKPFDNEGVSTQIKNIVKNGRLKTWLLDSYTARKLKLITTGNSGGIFNWLISYQNISFKDLLKKMNQGLLVTELMGQGVDIVSGNYSRGATGFWIENGTIAYPVNEITISGNLRDMWKNIISISHDVDKRKNIQCGSILVSNIQVSGY